VLSLLSVARLLVSEQLAGEGAGTPPPLLLLLGRTMPCVLHIEEYTSIKPTISTIRPE
jgi:hypothetical protein